MSTLVGIVAGGLVTWFFAWWYYRRSTNDLQTELASLKAELAALRASQPLKLPPATCAGLTALLERGAASAKRLEETGCKDEAIRHQSQALQSEIHEWLAANVTREAADYFKGAQASPFVVDGMAVKHASVYRQLQGRIGALRQITRDLCGK